MPLFNASPFAALPEKMTPGRPVYLFGSYNEKIAPTKFNVKDVQSSTTVATVTIQIVEGNIPAVGSLVTIYGTATNAQFNVTNAVLTGVTIVGATGAGTITFAGSFSAISITADSGEGMIPVPEVGDTVTATMTSVPAGLPYTSPFSSDQGSATIQCEVNFPTIPTAATVALQWAMTNTGVTVWQTAIANVVTVAAGSATYGTTQWTGKANFLRYSVTGGSGVGSIVGKVCL